MIQHRFALALAALALSIGLPHVADAYPTTARSGSTSVTGAYRPLDLNLTLVETNLVGLNTDLDTFFSFTGNYTGSFTGSGADYGGTPSGSAGTWRLRLGFGGDDVPLGEVAYVDGQLTLSTTAPNLRVGTLTYVGGFSLNPGTGQLPDDGSDTPVEGDVFLVIAPDAGEVMRAFVDDSENFNLVLLQDLVHLGPFNFDNCSPTDEFCLETGLNGERVNLACRAQGVVGCGLIARDKFSASSVPEPTTLALFGLGLAGLGWRARARR